MVKIVGEVRNRGRVHDGVIAIYTFSIQRVSDGYAEYEPSRAGYAGSVKYDPHILTAAEESELIRSSAGGTEPVPPGTCHILNKYKFSQFHSEGR